MPTVAVEEKAFQRHGIVHRAATDPIESIHDYNIPILPCKRPPAKDDFQQIRRQRKQHEPEHDQTKPGTSNGEGLVDDYA